jgi:hypothetical protein
MESELGALSSALKALGEIPAWSLVGVITAAGTVAMAMLQLVKELTPLRRRFQRQWIVWWIGRHAAEFNSALHDADGATGRRLFVKPEKVERQLVDLATGGDANAFYDLTTEQLVAQMNAAAQAALDYPDAHIELLAVLSEGVDVADVLILSSMPQTPARGRARSAAARTESSPESLAARSRVNNRIQRNLDAVQIAMGSRWKLWMQSISIALSTILIEAAVIATTGFRISTVLITLPIGIVGGYFAPVTRDLVAALQMLRK